VKENPTMSSEGKVLHDRAARRYAVEAAIAAAKDPTRSWADVSSEQRQRAAEKRRRHHEVEPLAAPKD